MFLKFFFLNVFEVFIFPKNLKLQYFPAVYGQSDLPVTQQCLGCICEAISSCDTSGSCAGDVCGPFRITWAYWSDAGKPTVSGESPEAATAYSNCARDTYCSALAVQGYMHKFQQVRIRTGFNFFLVVIITSYLPLLEN